MEVVSGRQRKKAPSARQSDLYSTTLSAETLLSEAAEGDLLSFRRFCRQQWIRLVEVAVRSAGVEHAETVARAVLVEIWYSARGGIYPKRDVDRWIEALAARRGGLCAAVGSDAEPSVWQTYQQFHLEAEFDRLVGNALAEIRP
jgi:hypothetical protein